MSETREKPQQTFSLVIEAGNDPCALLNSQFRSHHQG